MKNNLDLVSQLKSAVDYLGIEGTIDAMRQAIENKIGDENTCYVITEVCNSICLSIEDFENSKLRTDERKVAIAFCSYFLNTIFAYSTYKISKRLPLKLDRRSISGYISIITDAKIKNPKSNIDLIISTRYDNLKNIFITHKK